ncbi:MAG: hypothetical protein COX70_09265, partial [Flavobacteriales bacterium CG_4_10_14_0_2_um_filter_32_8]
FVNKIKEDIKKKQSSVKILSLKSNNVVIGEDAKKFIGKLNQLPDIIDIYTINEVIFSSNDVRYKDIINEMNLSLNKYVDYKISLDSNLIIGSQKIEKYT